MKRPGIRRGDALGQKCREYHPCEAARAQSLLQHPVRGHQPARDRPFRDAECLGRLAARAAFKFAQHDRFAVLVRQPRQFLVERGEQFGSVRLRFRRGHLGLPVAAFRGHRLRLECSVERDSIQVVADARPILQRVALADEHHERGLERVVRIGGVAEDAAAGAQHHRGVPADQRGERGLVAVVEESGEQFAVRGGVRVEAGRHAAKPVGSGHRHANLVGRYSL